MKEILVKQIILLVFGVAIVSTGCGGPSADYAKLGLVEISGTVTLDGVPVEGAAVYFYEPDERYCFGVTNSRGRYTAMLNSEKSGVTPGAKRVEITTRRNPLGEAAAMAEEDPDAEADKLEEKIPAAYNEKSKLEVVIETSDNALDFELKSDGSTASAT